MRLLAVYLALATTALAATALAANPVEGLQERIDSGEVRLEYREPRGYLDSVLEALGISPLTQTLVFSKTSAQFRLISPRSPRALYFNDEVYVGWVRGGPFLEVSTADAGRGAAFYTLDQRPEGRPRFRPDNGQCLQCHESARTLDIPGHLTRSVHPQPDGQPVFRLGTTNVDQRTPLAERFGGWYVTGAPFAHLGNRVLVDEDRPEGVETRDLSTVANLTDYLRPDSDVVAHLLLVHQTQMHNRIAKAGIEARKAISYRDEMAARFGDVSPESAASIRRRIEGPAEDLLAMMLFADEAPLPEGLEPSSALARSIEQRGTIYQLDLQRRLLKAPLSYLILSPTFEALPAETADYIARRLRTILAGQDDSGRFAYLTERDRQAIADLLADCKPRLLNRAVSGEE